MELNIEITNTNTGAVSIDYAGDMTELAAQCLALDGIKSDNPEDVIEWDNYILCLIVDQTTETETAIVTDQLEYYLSHSQLARLFDVRDLSDTVLEAAAQEYSPSSPEDFVILLESGFTVLDKHEPVDNWLADMYSMQQVPDWITIDYDKALRDLTAGSECVVVGDSIVYWGS